MNLTNAIKCTVELQQAEASSDPILANTIKYARMLEGNIRGTGIHACGFIICRDPISEHANALMLVSLAVLAESGRVVLHQETILLVSIVAALLLISPIRMFALKFKGFGLKGNELRYGFIVAAVAIIILLPAYSVLTIIVLYIVVSTLRWLFTRGAKGALGSK